MGEAEPQNARAGGVVGECPGDVRGGLHGLARGGDGPEGEGVGVDGAGGGGAVAVVDGPGVVGQGGGG